MRVVYFAALLTALPLQPSSAKRADDLRYIRAVSTLYSTAQLGGLVKAWCDARAPETRFATDTALAVWKSSHRLDEIEVRADSVLGA